MRRRMVAAGRPTTADRYSSIATRPFADRKPKAIGIPVPSGLQSRQVMEVAVADVLAQRAHDAPRVIMGAFDVHGHPVPAELQVAHAVPLTEMPRGLREVRMRLEPEPASVPDRAEHDPLGENQRHLHGRPRITAEGISTKRRELPPLDRLRPQGVLHAQAPGVDQELAHPHRTAPLTGNDDDDQPRFPCLGWPGVRPLRMACEPHARRPALVDPAADKRRLLLGLGRGEPPDQWRHSRGAHLEGAGDLLRRPSASTKLADTFQQFIIGHATMIPDTGTPDTGTQARRARRDREIIPPGPSGREPSPGTYATFSTSAPSRHGRPSPVASPPPTLTRTLNRRSTRHS